MSPQFHGVLACSGSATRFARAKGVPPPYPKHLEIIEGETILSRAIHSMHVYAGVPAITVTLNPQMKTQYLEELARIQDKFRTLEISYVISQSEPATTSHYLFDNIKKEIQNGVYLLDGTEKPINPYEHMLFGQGDIFLLYYGENKLHQFLAAQHKNIDKGDTVYINEENGFIYVGCRLDFTQKAENNQFTIRPYLHEFDLSFVHINEPCHIKDALEEGIPIIRGEGNLHFC